MSKRSCTSSSTKTFIDAKENENDINVSTTKPEVIIIEDSDPSDVDETKDVVGEKVLSTPAKEVVKEDEESEGEGSSTTTVEGDDHVEAAAASDEAEESKDRGAIGILFLAHMGVTNPSLWEGWRKSDPVYADRLKFFVFRNKAVTFPSAFIDKYDLKLRLRTRWCSSSIVNATIQSLRVIMEENEDVSMIYIVSGFDIPLQSPASFFTTRHVVTEGVPKTVVPFKTVLAFTPDEDTLLKETKEWRKKDEKIRKHVTSHVQWCGLTREHAQKIVTYPDTDTLLDIGNKMSGTCCPDEWIFGTILALQNVPRSATIDWPVTDQYREGAKDQSPLLWHNLDDSKRRVFWAPPNSYRTFTLGNIVEQVSRIEGNLFFRKVGPLKDEEVERLLRPRPRASSSSANKGESLTPRTPQFKTRLPRAPNVVTATKTTSSATDHLRPLKGRKGPRRRCPEDGSVCEC